MEQLLAADVFVKMLGKQVTECSTLKWFVWSIETFNTSDGSRNLEKQCADRVRKSLAAVRKAVHFFLLL